MKIRKICFTLVFFMGTGCAHGPSAEEVAAAKAKAEADAKAAQEAKAAAEQQARIEEDLFGPPKSYDQLASKFEFECPAPLYDFTQPHSVQLGEQQFWIHGSLVEREGDVDKQEWRIGILGAIKELLIGVKETIHIKFTKKIFINLEKDYIR